MTKWTLITDSGLVDKKVNPISATTVVGRESNCGLPIKKNEVSRKHAQLDVRDGSLFVKDFESANGTLVNGNKVSGEVQLKLNDKVTFEKVEFTVGEEQVAVVASNTIGDGDHVTTGVVKSVSAKDLATQVQLSVGTTFLTTVRGQTSSAQINLDNMHSLKIGRSNSCDLVLADPTVSGEHAQMTLESDGWQIASISQTNGVFVKGNKVLKCLLQDGDTIELGSAVLKFSTDAKAGVEGGRKIPDWMRDQG